MSAKKIITILGLAVLFVGIGIAGYFVFQKGLISFSVDPNIVPAKIQITNLSSDRFSISWITPVSNIGSIAYGQNSKLDQIQLDDLDQLTGQGKVRKVHHVTINNLKPASTYYFKIRSGEKNKQFDDEGKPFEVKTAPTLGSQPPTDMISGTVISADNKPAEGSVVYVKISGISPLSTQVKKDGSWLITLSNARNAQLTDYATYDKASTLIEMAVQGEDKVSSVVTNTANKSPVPQITLGETYDFSKEEVGNVGIGETVPENIEPLIDEDVNTETNESGLKPLESFPLTGDEAVIITYPTESQVINILKPEFKGTGPVDNVINISIVEDKLLSSSATIGKDGKWKFQFSKDLMPGQNYTLRIDYFDKANEAKEASRAFSIAATANNSNIDLPGYSDSSPSATPKSTPNPSTSPTATPVTTPVTTPTPIFSPSPTASGSGSSKGGVRNSMPSTSSGTPTSGTSLPTLLLTVFGLILIISGYFFRQEKRY